MQISDLSHLRLYAQGLTRQAFSTPAEVVRWFGALQAQDYPAACWAIGLRLPGEATQADIEQAVADRKIARTYPMRSTVHFVAAEDLRWILALNQERSRSMINNTARSNHLGLDEDAFQRCLDAIVRALRGGKQMTREELYAVLDQAGLRVEGLARLLLLLRAIVDGVICYATLRGKQHTLALVEEWLPPAPILDREAALAELTRRYFTSHGPATAQDFAWWANLTLSDVRAGLEMVGGDLASESIGEQTYWFSPDLPLLQPPVESILLLPNYDEYTVAYKDRSAVIDPAYYKVSFNGLNPNIVVNGQVAGTWKRVNQKNKIAVTLFPFKPLSESVHEGIGREVMRLEAFVGKEVIVETRQMVL